MEIETVIVRCNLKYNSGELVGTRDVSDCNIQEVFQTTRLKTVVFSSHSSGWIHQADIFHTLS